MPAYRLGAVPGVLHHDFAAEAMVAFGGLSGREIVE